MDDRATEGSVLESVGRDRRRLWVASMYLSLAATAGIFAVAGERWWIVLAVIPFVFASALYGKVIQPIVRGLTEKEDPELDERELMVRNRAYRRAYQALGAIFVLVLASAASFTVFFGAESLPVPRTLRDFALLTLLLGYLLISLPASIVAWTEPDPASED